MDNKAYLEKREWVWTEREWADPLSETGWAYTETSAIEIQRERDAERLDAVMAENEALKAALIDADNEPAILLIISGNAALKEKWRIALRAAHAEGK